MVKLFRTYNTYSDWKSEKTHPSNVICFIKDINLMYVNNQVFTAPSINVNIIEGNTLEVLSPVLKLYTTEQSSISVIDNSFTLLNHFTLINCNDTNNIIEIGSSINKITNVDRIELQKGDKITFTKNGTTWDIDMMLGSQVLIPSLTNGITGKSGMSISFENSQISTIPYVDMKTWNDSAAPLSKELLNTNYPDVNIGYQVVCPNINMIYEKVSTVGDWIASTTSSVN